MGRLLYYLPSGHRTESHVPHLPLPVSPPCCLFFPQTLAALLRSYSFTSLQPILPSLCCSCLLFFSFFFCYFPPLLSVQLDTVSFPLFRVHLLLSSSSPLSPCSLIVSFSSSPSSSPVDSCLSRGNLFIHPSAARSSAVLGCAVLCCAYLAV